MRKKRSMPRQLLKLKKAGVTMETLVFRYLPVRNCSTVEITAVVEKKSLHGIASMIANDNEQRC